MQDGSVVGVLRSSRDDAAATGADASVDSNRKGNQKANGQVNASSAPKGSQEAVLRDKTAGSRKGRQDAKAAAGRKASGQGAKRTSDPSQHKADPQQKTPANSARDGVPACQQDPENSETVGTKATKGKALSKRATRGAEPAQLNTPAHDAKISPRKSDAAPATPTHGTQTAAAIGAALLQRKRNRASNATPNIASASPRGSPGGVFRLHALLKTQNELRNTIPQQSQDT
jgi:hypothetical protein